MNSNDTTRRAFLLLLVLVLYGCGPSDNKAAEEQKILDVFDRYKQAVLNGDGSTAAELVTPKTHDLYQRFVDLSLDADESATRDLPFVDKLSVVMIRHRLDPETVRSMSGRDLFNLGITEGWTSQKSVVDLEVGEITIAGDQAWLDIKLSSTGEVARKQFNLDLVDGDWKIDFVELLRKIGPALEKQLKSQTGMSEDEIVKLIANVDQVQAATDKVWQPIGR